MNKNKTLIIFTPGFPKDENDTTCLPLQQSLVKAMQQQDAELKIIIISLQYPFSKKIYLWNGVEVHSLNAGSRLKKIIALFHLKRVIETIQKKENVIGFLSFWLGAAAWYGNYFSKKNKLPHFVWILGQDAKPDNKFIKKIKTSPSSFIAISDFIADEVEKNYKIRPAHIIYPGIETGKPYKETEVKKYDLMAAGSLIPLKQYNLFIEIIARLKKELPGISAVLCGAGAEENKLKNIAESLGVKENIQFTGEVPHKKVMKYMHHSKIFIHPSSYEGFGMVCIEALYAGADVISFVQPVNKPITNWFIAKTKEAMIEKCIELLRSNKKREPVLFRSIATTANEILALYR